ncbi:mitochondrial cardiolipin hydrolase isoform X1 [Drosophila nasuta]|uniref:mitochondrial cardiolipin hydrolase isoform X1 n=1 Tax=Drosophila nasuta TaxID=42062 RepID=UPI00295EC96A|nr:mitochondrial cardiolipin hydrolase isoform X1 [Drosophila nasuta]
MLLKGLSSQIPWMPIAVAVGAIICTEVICIAKKHSRIKKKTEEVIDVIIFNENTRSQDFPTSAMESMISYINQAQYSIDLAMYTFTNLEMFQALMEAHMRGVRLRIVTDLVMMTSTLTKMIDFKNAGFDIRCPSSKVMMHHKFVLIDAPKAANDISLQRTSNKLKTSTYRSLLLSGSVNWTNQGFHGNWENCIVMSQNDNRVIIAYATEFERMWSTFPTV